MRWPKSKIPCSQSAFCIALCLYALIGGCLRLDGPALLVLAVACYALAYAVCFGWVATDRRQLNG